MTDAEGVVLALAALGEAGNSPLLANGEEGFAAAGEDLVGVGLMAHVPHQPVARRVVHVVERDGQFHHPEAGAEVATATADGVEEISAQLVGEHLQLGGLEAAQIGGGVDLVEERRGRPLPGNFGEPSGHGRETL
ncbi:MAG: hypothetical protein KatS3mg124_2044 [Porticoccaceae bacterium]|nr:MAG: hypothetical protein KatS3mg124_2044 [Porticoccaceae bacterium]